jgi:uncharacterized protein YbaR (Trm112 family)/SAM-dependent methyltransferase
LKKHLLQYLVCPVCKEKLDCFPTNFAKEEIIDGKLICRECHYTYPILRGVPRMLRDSISVDKKETSEAFGWEWQQFHTLHSVEDYKTQFLDWIYPIRSEFFTDKVILDGGCGMGRFALIASIFGAKDVIAIDISDAVESAYHNVHELTNVHVVQGDIYQLPLRCAPRSQIDFAYSIGVLHHLPQPEAGFHSILKHIRPGGSIFGWVYGRENNDWLIHFVNPLREGLTSRFPRGMLYTLSYFTTLGLHPFLKLIVRPVNQMPALSGLKKLILYNEYLSWLSQYGFRHTHHVIFDHLVAPTAYYIHRAEFAAWFERAHLSEVFISARNNNSWRGYGQIPL